MIFSRVALSIHFDESTEEPISNREIDGIAFHGIKLIGRGIEPDPYGMFHTFFQLDHKVRRYQL